MRVGAKVGSVRNSRPDLGGEPVEVVWSLDGFSESFLFDGEVVVVPLESLVVSLSGSGLEEKSGGPAAVGIAVAEGRGIVSFASLFC